MENESDYLSDRGVIVVIKLKSFEKCCSYPELLQLWLP